MKNNEELVIDRRINTLLCLLSNGNVIYTRDNINAIFRQFKIKYNIIINVDYLANLDKYMPYVRTMAYKPINMNNEIIKDNLNKSRNYLLSLSTYNYEDAVVFTIQIAIGYILYKIGLYPKFIEDNKSIDYIVKYLDCADDPDLNKLCIHKMANIIDGYKYLKEELDSYVLLINTL